MPSGWRATQTAASVRMERRAWSTAPAVSTSVLPRTWMRTEAARRAAVARGGIGGSGTGGRPSSWVSSTGANRPSSAAISASVAREAVTMMPRGKMRAVPEASISIVQRPCRLESVRTRA